ncbi:MAG: CopY/TcrY family copper transport repressor [Aerococcus sp.]|nr:CopY/TcrY family copper transport repressor [Aerococcus sp.]
MSATTPISNAEYEVMRILWAQGETTSKFATDVLQDKKQWKTATVKTLLHRLVEKGYITKTKEKNHYRYQPAITEEEARHERMADLLHDTCATKADQVIIDAIESATLDHHMLERIQQALATKTVSDTVHCQCEPGQCDCHPALDMA